MSNTAAKVRVLTIREYDVLFLHDTSKKVSPGFLSKEDWHWLHDQSFQKSEGPAFFRPLFRNGRRGLQAQNFVGTIETPIGTQIEILPKLTDLDGDLVETRRIVLKMLGTVLNLKTHSWRQGSLTLINQPLNEHLIDLFLSDLEALTKRGLRSCYLLKEDQQPFLKGRLQIEKQLQRRPGARPSFHIEHHEYLPDRPENRLIHSALVAVSQSAKHSNNQRRIRSLRFHFAEIPESTGQRVDFQNWSTDRSLLAYRGMKTWCELILRHTSPLFLAGKFTGLSFLFPMEQLFERYVTAILRNRMKSGFHLVPQPARHSLVTHQDAGWFRLKPDLIVESPDGSCSSVLDTKWKRIDARLGSAKDKYGLSQNDFYQMAAYGDHYLNGSGDMFLIYPASPVFTKPLPAFHLSPTLRLWAVPFDLRTDRIDALLMRQFSRNEISNSRNTFFGS
ncbi:McrC family protein [bacterium]|nr:McrC family protein [bacterium]